MPPGRRVVDHGKRGGVPRRESGRGQQPRAPRPTNSFATTPMYIRDQLWCRTGACYRTTEHRCPVGGRSVKVPPARTRRPARARGVARGSRPPRARQGVLQGACGRAMNDRCASAHGRAVARARAAARRMPARRAGPYRTTVLAVDTGEGKGRGAACESTPMHYGSRGGGVSHVPRHSRSPPSSAPTPHTQPTPLTTFPPSLWPGARKWRPRTDGCFFHPRRRTVSFNPVAVLEHPSARSAVRCSLSRRPAALSSGAPAPVCGGEHPTGGTRRHGAMIHAARRGQ